MRKRRSKGTGYKYFDVPARITMSSANFLRALQRARLANDAYKYKSLFVTEMMRIHEVIRNGILNTFRRLSSSTADFNSAWEKLPNSTMEGYILSMFIANADLHRLSSQSKMLILERVLNQEERAESKLRLKVAAVAGYLARQTWSNPSIKSFKARCAPKIESLEFNADVYVRVAEDILDQLTAPFEVPGITVRS